MSKWVYVFGVAGFACLVLLMLISLPFPRQATTTPFLLEDGTSGAVKLIIPETLQQQEWAEIELDVTFDDAGTSDQNVKIKTILQTASMEVKPAGEVTAVIQINGTAPFRWLVRSTSLGEQRAALWCFREGEEGQTLILARELEFKVRSVLGITFPFLRWILGTTVVLCVLLFIRSLKNRKNQAVSD
jgi:hypothetical protein